MKFLSNDAKVTLRSQHKHERDGRVRDRIKAILLHDQGWTFEEIAEALLISDQAVRNHIDDYNTSNKLKPENGGSKSKLNSQQTRALLEHLQEHTYLYVKDIVAYVMNRFKIAYTIAGMHSWLKTHDFSYKKPSVVPGKVNREAQEKWIQEYKNLSMNLPENETICFIDGVHFANGATNLTTNSVQKIGGHYIASIVESCPYPH